MRTSAILSVVVLSVALAACERKPEPQPPAPPPAPKVAPAKAVALVPAPKPAPATSAWQVSADQKTWAPVELPNTEWKCDRCDRFFKTTIQGVPKAVKFRFASDNKARMMVNGLEAFADFWKDGYCTDKPCCGKCCDAVKTCQRLVAEGTPYELSPAALKAFREGDNEVIWEVHQEGGGSGFHVEMDVAR